uniref:Putative secreted protein n=1 Tax=Anopheles marajoara TaxID=58244 RepID=A0A2M4CCN4_9DIPT
MLKDFSLCLCFVLFPMHFACVLSQKRDLIPVNNLSEEKTATRKPQKLQRTSVIPFAVLSPLRQHPYGNAATGNRPRSS